MYVNYNFRSTSKKIKKQDINMRYSKTILIGFLKFTSLAFYKDQAMKTTQYTQVWFVFNEKSQPEDLYTLQSCHSFESMK